MHTSALNFFISFNKSCLLYSQLKTRTSDQSYKNEFFSSNSWANMLYDSRLKSIELFFAEIKFIQPNIINFRGHFLFTYNHFCSVRMV